MESTPTLTLHQSFELQKIRQQIHNASHEQLQELCITYATAVMTQKNAYDSIVKHALLGHD